MLITFLLIERNLLAKPVLYLSYSVKRNRATYHDKLQAVRDEGASEDWIAFFLKGVVEVSREAYLTAQAILSMRERARARITEGLGRAAGNAFRVMDRLFEQPIVTVGTVRDRLDVTPAGANNLVRRLVSIGLLQEVTGFKRNRKFRFEPYLRLFEDQATEGRP